MEMVNFGLDNDISFRMYELLTQTEDMSQTQ